MSIRSRGHVWRTRSRPHAAPGTSARTSSAAVRASTSRCARAPARTSAARRPRSSTRSRDFGASLGASRRFPTDVGLFGRPTVVNNVETLANVLPIVLHGGDAFAASGSGMSTGTKLFCLSGHVARPGVYEVPFGPTLRELLDLAGGVSGTGNLQAVLLGGVAGRFVGPEALDTPLTFEGARAIGASLGSGVVLPLDDTVDLRPLLVRIAGFFRDESCGQCVPCRIGTVRQQEVLVRLTAGRAMRVGSSRCSTKSVAACATRRSADSARPPTTRSSRPSAASHPSVQQDQAMADVEVDGHAVDVPDGSTLLDACRHRGRRRADAVLRRHAGSEERVPHLRRGARRKPRAGTRLFAGSRRRHGRAHPDRSRRARAQVVLELLASTAELDWAPHVSGWIERVRRRPRPVRRRLGHGAPAGEGRQRPLRARLLAASFATSASTRAASSGRTRSPSRSRGGASTPTSRPNATWGCPSPPACTAATASRSAPPARSCSVDRVRHAPGRLMGRGPPDRNDDDLRLLRRRLQPRAACAGQPDREGDVP